jgi:plastocyanin
MGRFVAVATAGLLGAAVAVGPGLAGAQAPGASVTAADYSFSGGDGTTPAALTVGAGATVTFSYPAGSSRHDVHFSGAAPDACTGSSGQVGGAPTPAGPGWSATCSFTAPGTYAFFCDVHPGMTGTIAVAAATTAPQMTPPPDSTASTPSTPSAPSAPTAPSAPSAPSPAGAPHATPQTQSHPVAAGHLLASAVQHGTRVRATITLSRSGSSLTARLLGPASAGQLSRHGVKAGALHFSVALTGSARRTLKAKHQLRLTLVVTVAAPGRTTTTLKRTLVVKA